jgi:hypothetical protein
MCAKLSVAAAKKAAEETRIKHIIAEMPVNNAEFKAAVSEATIIQLKWVYVDVIDVELHRGGNISRLDAISKAITGKLIVLRQEKKQLHKEILDYMQQAQKLSEANEGEFIVFAEGERALGIAQGMNKKPEGAMQIAAFLHGKKIREAVHI